MAQLPYINTTHRVYPYHCTSEESISPFFKSIGYRYISFKISAISILSLFYETSL
jgi:hypothetical protein